jgi:hypothetical protein
MTSADMMPVSVPFGSFFALSCPPAKMTTCRVAKGTPFWQVDSQHERFCLTEYAEHSFVVDECPTARVNFGHVLAGQQEREFHS